MKCSVKDGKLTIVMDLESNPRPSKSGKTLIAASTGGFQKADCAYNGQPLSVSVNAVIPKGGE